MGILYHDNGTNWIHKDGLRLRQIVTVRNIDNINDQGNVIETEEGINHFWLDVGHFEKISKTKTKTIKKEKVKRTVFNINLRRK